jgi:hypothetical protein
MNPVVTRDGGTQSGYDRAEHGAGAYEDVCEERCGMGMSKTTASVDAGLIGADAIGAGSCNIQTFLQAGFVLQAFALSTFFKGAAVAVSASECVC